MPDFATRCTPNELKVSTWMGCGKSSRCNHGGILRFEDQSEQEAYLNFRTKRNEIHILQ